jgi:hypothetical protein
MGKLVEIEIKFKSVISDDDKKLKNALISTWDRWKPRRKQHYKKTWLFIRST